MRSPRTGEADLTRALIDQLERLKDSEATRDRYGGFSDCENAVSVSQPSRKLAAIGSSQIDRRLHFNPRGGVPAAQGLPSQSKVPPREPSRTGLSGQALHRRRAYWRFRISGM